MKKPVSRSASRKNTSDDELIALTVKLDSETYVRLSTFRAKERKTGQAIMTDALRAYLDRMGG